MSTTRYNPNREHEGVFNYEPQQKFTEITEQDWQEVQDRLQELIRKSREQIGE